MTTYTTPSKVNKALKAAGLDVEIVRGNGYYWFADETTEIRSIYECRLSDTPAQIVDYVRAELARIKGE